MQVDGKGKYANARYMLHLGTPYPQAGLLTGRWVIPIVPVESLSFFMLLSQQFHGGFVVCLLLHEVSCGVLNMLGKSSVGQLCPFIDVANSDVEVAQPLREVAITSS